MAKIRGSIVGESDKAIKLNVTEDSSSNLTGKMMWFPKSQIRLDEDEVNIVIPNWLYEEKANQEE